MRILCAYTDLYDATRKALDEYATGATVDYVDVSGDDYAYWRAISERWTGDDDLLIVEQDIEIHKSVIRQMEFCQEPWCAFPYRLWRPDAWCYNALGCTKFSAGLQRTVPTAEIEQIQVRWLMPNAVAPGKMEYQRETMAEGALCGCGGQGAPPCWRHVDFKVADTLEGRGPGRRPYSVHVHQPAVVHMPVDRPVNEAAARVTAFPFQMSDVRLIEFPVIEPTRVHHTASLADRPEWWPKKEPGVVVSVKDHGTRRVLTSADVLDPDVSDELAGHLFITDKSDFGAAHDYFPVYRKMAREIGRAGNACEVGVWRGESLRMWKAFFPDGTTVGVDYDERSSWPPGTVQVVSDQDDEALPARLAEICPDGFDLIVDDASHEGDLTRKTWELLWPLVRPGGRYVVEDWSEGTLHAMAWMPGAVESMLRLAESFLPLLRLKGCDPESVEYRYGMIIMRKRAQGEPGRATAAG
jgi:Methyltransferase domain